jgi:hypothetical protein
VVNLLKVWGMGGDFFGEEKGSCNLELGVRNWVTRPKKSLQFN